jgi:hypothetical protein
VQDGQAWRKGNWLTGALWVVSLAAHFGLDYLIDPHSPDGGIAGASLLLYLAVTFTVQRVIMQARARRIPVPTNHPAQSVTQGPAQPWSGP